MGEGDGVELYLSLSHVFKQCPHFTLLSADSLHGSKSSDKVDVDNLVHAKVNEVAGQPPLFTLVGMLGEEDIPGRSLVGGGGGKKGEIEQGNGAEGGRNKSHAPNREAQGGTHPTLPDATPPLHPNRTPNSPLPTLSALIPT